MALIKAQSAATLLREAIVLDLGDLGRQAARLQEAADARAARTIGEAEAEAARLIEEGRRRGLEEGRAAGRQEGRAEGLEHGRAEALAQAAAEFAQIQQAWLTAGARWEENRAAIERDAQQAVLALALKLAEKLVHRIVEVDPSVIADQLAAALAHVLSPADVSVHVHPDDRAALEQAMPDLLAEFAHLKSVRLIDDAATGRGGCTLSYGQGRIDATIDTQLRRIVELLLPTATADIPSEDPTSAV